jgi:poly[(R)-3-hydroxyalkanoate] polymerase subunit PhaC
MSRLPGLGLADNALGFVERNLHRVRNGIKLIADVDRPVIGASPKQTMFRHGRTEVWRYDGERRSDRLPVVLVPSVINRSNVLDLRPGGSFVERAVVSGLDVFMVDWGVADERDAARGLTSYVDEHLPRAIDAVLDTTGADGVVLFGYCMGGLLAVLTTAGHPELPIRALLALTTPVDLSKMGFPLDAMRTGKLTIDQVVDHRGLVPEKLLDQGIRMVRPTSLVIQGAEVWQNLWNDAYVSGFRAIEGWARGHVPVPGQVLVDLLELATSDEPAAGRFAVGGRIIDLGDIECPVLKVVAERDSLVPTSASEPLMRLIGSLDKQEIVMPVGHIGVVVGRRASICTDQMVAWFHDHAAVR